MINVFTVPTSGERFDDPGRFATMLIERGVEDRTFAVVGEPLVRTDVRGEFATEIIVEGPLREPREELARKCAESIPASEATYCPLDFLGRRPKKRRQHRPDQRRQAFDGSHLRHLAQVSSAAPGAGILINCGGEASQEIHQTRRDTDSHTEPSQILDEFRTSCGERDLGQKRDQQFGQDIGKSVGEYAKDVNPTLQAPGVHGTASDLLTKAIGNGTIPRDEYQALRSRFSKKAENLRTSDPQQAQAYRGFRNALDSAMERSVQPSDAGAWADLRSKWANLDALDNAAGAAGPAAAQGYITPAQLRASIGKDAYSRGWSGLSDLTRAGVGAMTPLPQSGTGPRSYYQHLTELLGGAGIGGMLGGVPGAAEGLAAAVGGPAIAGRMLMSQPVQAYLKNQAAPNLGLISKMDPAAQELTRGTNLLQTLFRGSDRSDRQVNQ